MKKKNYLTFKNKEICGTKNLDEWFSEKVMDPLLCVVEEFSERDSGWTMMAINNLSIQVNKYNSLRAGGSYIGIPPWIKCKKAVINVENNDEDCFF